jgi:hypothetical protein
LQVHLHLCQHLCQNTVLLARNTRRPVLCAVPSRVGVGVHSIKLPQGGVGRDYVLVQLTVDGKGPFDFMLDSGMCCVVC